MLNILSARSAESAARWLRAHPVSITGAERSTVYTPSGCTARSCSQVIYDNGTVTLTVNGHSETVSYGQGSTYSSIASALASAINGDSNSPVSASALNGTVTLTAKTSGAATNYSLTASTAWDSQYFSSASFTATTSGSTLTGGANAVDSGAVMSEQYSYDAWGNMTQSGNYSFQNSFTANNRVNGLGYDSAGELTSDGMNSYSYDAEGMLTGTGSAKYTYDALQQRVEKLGGSNASEIVYFNGHPIALLNPSSNTSTTDLIWAGDSLLAEVGGSQTATPTYRLLDHESTLAKATDGGGNVLGTNVFAPYGQAQNEQLGNAYAWTGLFQDTEYSGDAAWYRDYSARAGRWLTPDPYNGSYNTYRPQSFNRYMYVNGNPMGDVDPSGEAGAGILTGIGGAPCKAFGATISISGTGLSFNPCNPIGSSIADGVILASAYFMSLNTGDSIASLIGVIKLPDGTTVNGAWVGPSGMIAQIGAVVGAAITIGCSIDSNSAICGQAGWTGALIGGDAGKVVGDSIAVAEATACVAAPVAGCLADAIYTIANDVFSVFWDMFGRSKFTGSLLPRPSDLGGLGTAPIGIPNQNLTVRQLLGSQSTSAVPSPGMVRP